MRGWRRMSIALAVAVAGWGGESARGALVINLGSHDATAGATDVSIPIMVSGGDSITDMRGYVQVGDGGPVVGGTAGPKINSISYAGSIWATVPDGITTFMSLPLPGQIVDPSVSVNTSGQAAIGAGTLMTVHLDASGFPAGSTFDLKMTGLAGANVVTFVNGSVEIPVTINNGTLRIVAVPEPSWMALGAAVPVAVGVRRRRGGKRIIGA